MTPPIPTPALLSAAQVSVMLGISVRTLWRLKSAGKIPTTVRVGNSVRWRREELIAWISEGCQMPVSSEGHTRRKG